ncbi:hypothetical protein PAMP_012609 [Pampus punctatissimus]
MATGVNYWSSYEPSYKVRECVWGGEQESSSEDGGGGVTWETQAMEVKGQLISAPDPLICPDRKQRERMAELQERRRSLQALLSTRLAELRRICLQEAELTGAVPSDFPLEAGEKPPCVRRRGGTSRTGNRKCRAEEDEETCFFLPLFDAFCLFPDDTVRSESSSTSDSTGHDNDDGVSQWRPPLVSAGSPVEVFYQNKTKRNSLHNRTEHPENLQTHKPLPLPPPLPLQPPPSHPPHSRDSSSSSGPSDAGAAGEAGIRVTAARRSNSSDGVLDRIISPEEDGGRLGQQGGLWVQGTNAAGAYRSSETLAEGRTRTNNELAEGGGRGGGTGRGRGGRGGGYSEVLLDYVWGKQQQLQRQQSQTNRQPIASHHPLIYNGYSSQQPPVAPPTYRGHLGDQRRVKVTRTKSCGPFLPVQQNQADTYNPPVSAIQPDPHPHLLPPRPPQLLPSQDAQLEEATRSLHKALALEGLRDWYLRNTIGSSHTNQANGKVNAGVTGQAGGGALQRRRTTHGVIQQPTYQTETSHHPALHHKQTALPHSATFHGHPLHARSVDSSLYHDSFPPQKQEVPSVDQPSPGTLV